MVILPDYLRHKLEDVTMLLAHLAHSGGACTYRVTPIVIANILSTVFSGIGIPVFGPLMHCMFGYRQPSPLLPFSALRSWAMSSTCSLPRI